MSDVRPAPRRRPPPAPPLVTVVLGALAGLLLMDGAGAVGQSLGDLARREADRQARIVEHGWVYDNATLEPAPPTSRVGTERPASEPSVAEAVAEAEPDVIDASPATSEELAQPGGRSEAEWRARADSLRARIAELQASGDALETNLQEIRRLATPSPEGAALADRDAARARALLERVTRDVSMLKEAWMRLEDDARRHDIPLAWLQSGDP